MFRDQVLLQKLLQKALHSLPESFPSYLTWEHASGCGFVPISQAHDLEHEQ